MAEPNLTDRQRKWFASVRDGLERDTCRTMAQWVAIARTCPETGHRARLKWFKETHGLLQNRASLVIGEAFGSPMSWNAPTDLTDALWGDAGSRAIYQALDAQANALPDVVATARKGYSAWSRKVQFAAARPLKAGGVMLGLAVPVEIDPRLAPRGSQSWSERLTARMVLSAPADVDPACVALLRTAWERA